MPFSVMSLSTAVRLTQLHLKIAPGALAWSNKTSMDARRMFFQDIVTNNDSKWGNIPEPSYF